MSYFKPYLLQFLTWMRNGFAFCTTWFLILLTGFGLLHGAEAVTMKAIVFLLLWCAGAVLLFCLMFTRLLLRRMGFTSRLIVFMGLMAGYQLLLPIWWMNPLHFLFGEPFPLLYGSMTSGGMLVYILIIAMLCGTCLAIHHVYSKKKGALYTQALQKYQADHAGS
ncbi:MAG: hypothetical protein IJN11_04315 [Oscillospiraceae bacterium]|nr:hypothetical protein [Oscillospiraceae bacterium]